MSFDKDDFYFEVNRVYAKECVEDHLGLANYSKPEEARIIFDAMGFLSDEQIQEVGKNWLKRDHAEVGKIICEHLSKYFWESEDLLSHITGPDGDEIAEHVIEHVLGV